MHPSRQLQPKDVTTLRSLRDTLAALDALIDAVRGMLERLDGLVPVRGGIDREDGYVEARFHLPKTMRRWPRGSRLYFGIDYDECFAGIRWSAGRVEELAWFDRYVDADWDYEGTELWRSKPLKTVVQTPEQAQALYGFVHAAFEQLAVGPYPPRRT